MAKDVFAIIGATGNVGRKILELALERHSWEPKAIKLFASKKSRGVEFTLAGHHYIVADLADYDFADCKIAVFATESDVSKAYIDKALTAGAKVVDASSAYRLDPDVPLVVPPVNAAVLTAEHRLAAHANCLASPISVVLKPLHDYAKATRVVVSTYQSTSGAGKAAMDELLQHTKSTYGTEDFQHKNFPRPIAFNVIPQVSDILSDGFTYEEFKIIKEVQKVVSSDIQMVATAVRVPVLIGHSISMAIEFAKPITLEGVKALLAKSPGVILSEHDYHTPLEVQGSNKVFVGRMRIDPTVPHGLLLWLVSDNLRRGAALDAVEIAEKMLSFG
jgi:aspartate-semialdehyde dehydrogenase